MTRADWLEVSALVADLWPNQEWSRETIASSFALVAELPLDPIAAFKAVRELASAGREFAPPPGVVASHLKAISASTKHLLAPPDLIRDQTPEEQVQAQEFARRIRERINEIAKTHQLSVRSD